MTQGETFPHLEPSAAAVVDIGVTRFCEGVCSSESDVSESEPESLPLELDPEEFARSRGSVRKIIFL